ncbi:MAG TPA: TonB-dependent receptor plug domain-containing protein, partial [Mucilaginibacter sp.]|nr:TonB-dependent receptor plug domain-containing protein [Mucilaginibacter sp.]
MKKTVPYICIRSCRLPGTILLFCISSAAFAQIDTTKKLKQVNVSSAKTPLVETITPSQQISSADFTKYNAFNVADAIRNFSGVVIKDYGGIAGLKTVSVRGLGANHTSVLYDGIQLNDAENGQVDLGKLNLNSIQQITLYNGQPADILMPARAFASASVLSIKTVKPDLTAAKPYQITAGIKGGTFGLINPYLQWQQRISDNWSFIVNSYSENANGQYKYLINNGATTTQQTRVGSDITTQQVDGALYWTKNDSNKFNLHVSYYNSDRGVPGAVILYTPPPNGQHLWDQDFFTQAGYEHAWQSGLKLLINSKFSNSYRHYLDPQFPNSAGVLDQHFKQREFYQSAALSYHLLPKWDISYAADFALNNMDSDNANFRYPTRITLLNVLASNFVLNNVTFQASLLNTNVSETVRTGSASPSRNIYSPTIIATIKPLADKNFQLRAFYKYIFREPTFDEIYYGFINNTNLQPELVNQYDLGFTYTKTLPGVIEYITLTTDAYYNNISNKIIYNPASASSRNFGKVDIKGLDAGLKSGA